MKRLFGSLVAVNTPVAAIGAPRMTSLSTGEELSPSSRWCPSLAWWRSPAGARRAKRTSEQRLPSDVRRLRYLQGRCDGPHTVMVGRSRQRAVSFIGNPG